MGKKSSMFITVEPATWETLHGVAMAVHWDLSIVQRPQPQQLQMSLIAFV